MQPVGAWFGVAFGWGVRIGPRQQPDTSAAKTKQYMDHPRQHSAVLDNAHRTAVSSISTHVGF